MNFNVAGITFRRDRSPEISSLRPVGAVSFIAEPDNPVDAGAVKVMYKGLHIGYVPRGDLQGLCLKHKTAIVEDYKYYDGTWNSEHKGQFQSCTVGIEQEQESNGRVIGGKYLRVTNFLKYFDPYGGGDGLIRWAFDQSDTFDGYKKALNDTAEAGTAMHAAIESHLEHGTSDGLPDGWAAFAKKYKPEMQSMEVRFYDNELMVTGQYDFLGTVEVKGVTVLCVVDWKSSKKPSMKHKIQASIYAKNVGAEGALIVAFGAENVQRYSASFISGEQIESNYMGMRHVKAAMDACGVWVQEYWGD